MKILSITPGKSNSDNLELIIPAIDSIPVWYKKSKSTMGNRNTYLDMNQKGSLNATYKKCMPIFDAMTIGYMFVLECDIEVAKDVDGNTRFMWVDNGHVISSHSEEQVEGFPIPKDYVVVPFKFENKLIFNTPKNTSMLFINPINRLDLPFTTIGGVVETDRYNMEINFPFLIKKDFTGIIEKGTPIIQMIPFERHVWKRKYIKYDADKVIKAYKNYRTIIRRPYKKLFWVRKEYN
jgi:hypothetical protein